MVKLLQSYFKDVKRRKRISRAREIELSEIILSGGKGALAARNELVEANLRFAIHIAREYFNIGIPIEDLIQEANIGLIKAAEKYDWQFGAFTTYAHHWIRQSIFESYRKYGQYAYIPSTKIPIIYRFKEFEQMFAQKYNRYPTVDDFIRFYHIKERGVKEFLWHYRMMCSLESPIYTKPDDADCLRLKDVLCEEDTVNDNALDMPIMEDIIRNRLPLIMNSKEYSALMAWCGLSDLSVNEYLQLHNTTIQCMRQRKRRALKKIRESKYAEMLSCFADFQNKLI